MGRNRVVEKPFQKGLPTATRSSRFSNNRSSLERVLPKTILNNRSKPRDRTKKVVKATVTMLGEKRCKVIRSVEVKLKTQHVEVKLKAMPTQTLLIQRTHRATAMRTGQCLKN